MQRSQYAQSFRRRNACIEEEAGAGRRRSPQELDYPSLALSLLDCRFFYAQRMHTFGDCIAVRTVLQHRRKLCHAVCTRESVNEYRIDIKTA